MLGTATPGCASIICFSVRQSPERLLGAGVDREIRGLEKASDHAPDVDRDRESLIP
jgi:hypothetical protein